MTAPVTLPHPRRLYAMIRACTTPATRAQAVLESLRACTGAGSGFLFLAKGNELLLMARTADKTPPSGLQEEATRAWSQQPKTLSSDSTIADTLTKLQIPRVNDEMALWTSGTGQAFGQRLLSIYRGSRWLAVGIAMLEPPQGKPLVSMHRVHVEALCNALIDAGDVADAELDPQPA